MHLKKNIEWDLCAQLEINVLFLRQKEVSFYGETTKNPVIFEKWSERQLCSHIAVNAVVLKKTRGIYSALEARRIKKWINNDSMWQAEHYSA